MSQKRYIVDIDNGSARTRWTKRYSIVFMAPDYRTAWKNCRNELRVGGDFFDVTSNENVHLAGGAFRVRSVFTDDAAVVSVDALLTRAVADGLVDADLADALRQLAGTIADENADAAA